MFLNVERKDWTADSGVKWISNSILQLSGSIFWKRTERYTMQYNTTVCDSALIPKFRSIHIRQIIDGVEPLWVKGLQGPHTVTVSCKSCSLRISGHRGTHAIVTKESKNHAIKSAIIHLERSAILCHCIGLYRLYLLLCPRLCICLYFDTPLPNSGKCMVSCHGGTICTDYLSTEESCEGPNCYS